jgi:hypothetical protein
MLKTLEIENVLKIKYFAFSKVLFHFKNTSLFQLHAVQKMKVAEFLGLKWISPKLEKSCLNSFFQNYANVFHNKVPHIFA